MLIVGNNGNNRFTCLINFVSSRNTHLLNNQCSPTVDAGTVLANKKKCRYYVLCNVRFHWHVFVTQFGSTLQYKPFFVLLLFWFSCRSIKVTSGEFSRNKKIACS